MLKISIITVCYNSEQTISKTIKSVLNQSYSNIEYIIIDGDSKDSTKAIISKYVHDAPIKIRFFSEKDKGIYDAINKGINIATGDIIGILNSDDIFFDNHVVSKIANLFHLYNDLDSIVGDIIFVKSNDSVHRIYSSKNWTPKQFEWGMMPPHPTFYCKKSIYEKYGLYRLDFKIASDYELMMRFLLINKISYRYLPFVFVKMSLGGVSTKNFQSKILINKEVLYACKINNVESNIFKIYSKYFRKIFQFIKI